MKKYNYSNEIANVVKQFLTDDDWHYSFDEERGIFDFGLRGEARFRRSSTSSMSRKMRWWFTASVRLVLIAMMRR